MFTCSIPHIVAEQAKEKPGFFRIRWNTNKPPKKLKFLTSEINQIFYLDPKLFKNYFCDTLTASLPIQRKFNYLEIKPNEFYLLHI